MILNIPQLKQLFTNITSAGPKFTKVAKLFGFNVIEIYANSNAIGVIAAVTQNIAEKN